MHFHKLLASQKYLPKMLSSHKTVYEWKYIWTMIEGWYRMFSFKNELGIWSPLEWNPILGSIQFESIVNWGLGEVFQRFIFSAHSMNSKIFSLKSKILLLTDLSFPRKKNIWNIFWNTFFHFYLHLLFYYLKFQKAC